MTIESLKEKVRPVCEKYGIRALYLMSEDSDVFYIDDEDNKLNGWNLGGFYSCLQEVTGKKQVDFNMKFNNSREMHDFILNRVILYARA